MHHKGNVRCAVTCSSHYRNSSFFKTMKGNVWTSLAFFSSPVLLTPMSWPNASLGNYILNDLNSFPLYFQLAKLF